MAAEQHQDQNTNAQGAGDPPVDVSTNPDLGIKKVRTFADDLAEAKAKAGGGGEEDSLAGKKKSFFARKEKEKEVPPKKEEPKVLEPIAPVPQAPKQPSKEFIEQELARSGIVTQERGGSKNDDSPVSDDTGIPAIRTYKYDAAETIEERGASQIDILAAEQRRRTRNKDFSSLTTTSEEAPNIQRNIILIVVSIVLIASGAWGMFHFYNKSKIENDPAIVPNEGVLLFTNLETTIQVDKASGNMLRTQLENAHDNATGDATSITEFVLTESGVFGMKELTANVFIRRLSDTPIQLARTVEPQFVYGLHTKTPSSIVLLLKAENYDSGFGGMLEWERTIVADLLGDESLATGNFSDVVIRNKDTRLITNDAGETVLIYAFANAETIVITQDEDTFFEVFDRLSASNATRN